MGTTANYSWVYPTVNADADAWGTILNTMAIAIDTTVKANADTAASGLAAKAPLASPTFTGIVTGPDAGAWSSSGITGLTKLGIGTATPTFVLEVHDNRNASILTQCSNNSAGAASSARYRVENGTNALDFVMGGTGNTVGGAFEAANLAAISTATTAGLNIGTSANSPVRIYANNTFHAMHASDGSFLVGSTTPAGSGAIAATGNITAFYSDDRLKTRQGNIEGALGKVISLQGFYYGPNDTARALGYDYEREVGISAQDVQKVMPEVIAPAPIDPQYMTVRYDRLIPLLIEAIKELDAKKADA